MSVIKRQTLGND